MPTGAPSDGRDAGGFFGRRADVARITELLACDGTTVTLVGPPGVGKTRLAMEVVRCCGAIDVVACELGEARTTEDLIARLGERLGVGGEERAADRLGERVANVLDERGTVLLVLDGLEQLADVAAGLFARLRRGAPAARWLATSRQPLGIEAEWLHEVHPLAVAHSDAGPSDAVRMLCDRVHRARGGPISERELEVLDRIAVRLDGLPLALELAAARIARLGAGGVEARLTQQLPVLACGRHVRRTLREAIAWSWALLRPGERAALAQLSVFRGGFDLEGAEAVVDTGDGTTTLDVVEALRYRSLLHVRPDQDGALRFGIYLSIQEYAEGELAPAAAAAVFRRHAAYFASLVERTADPARLAAERDNLFAAIDRSLDEGTPPAMAIAARVLAGLAPLVDHTPLEPYLERLERFLATAPDPVDVALHLAVQSAAARCMRRLGRLRDAERLYTLSLDLARTIRDRSSEAHLRGELGMVAFLEGQIDHARQHWGASRALYRASGDGLGLGRTLVREGIALREAGWLARAREQQLAALDLLERVPTDTLTVLSLAELAHVHIELGELDDASRILDDAMARPSSLLAEAAVRLRRAFLAIARGRFDEARLLTGSAQGYLARAGHRRFEGGAACYAGILELVRGDLSSARRALESAQPALRHEPRGAHLCSAWLAYATFVAGDHERARRRFDALPPLAPDDACAITGAILHAPLAGGDHAARARELGGTIVAGTGRPAAASSLDVRIALTALARLGAVAVPAHTELRVDRDGAAFEHAGGRCSLVRHRTLRRILLALVEKRLSAPGEALPWQELFDAGWPHERAHRDAARNRVKVAISTLRAFGLRELVMHDGTGYVLDPAARVHVLGASAPQA